MGTEREPPLHTPSFPPPTEQGKEEQKDVGRCATSDAPRLHKHTKSRGCQEILSMAFPSTSAKCSWLPQDRYSTCSVIHFVCGGGEGREEGKELYSLKSKAELSP